MKRSVICLLVCLMQIFSNVQAEGKYTIIAPGTIHSNDKYTASVSVHHMDQPCTIKVGITGPSYNTTQDIVINKDEIKNVHFDVPELESGDYNLTAQGVNCLDDFKNTTKLAYAKFNNHVRIQTDKGVYKPGDEMNYRVLFLDKDLRPADKQKDTIIWIEDGKRNRIKEIKDFTVTKGVHTGKFKISDFPIMGSWRMGVSNGNDPGRIVHFDVKKYVAPTFVVKVDATESVSVKDGDMQVIVKANYTYGKPLNGKATIFLDKNYYRNGDKNQPPTIIRSADMAQGKAKIDFNVKELESYFVGQAYPSNARIVATVEEEFTGVKINASTYTLIYPYRYSMKCLTDTNCYSFVADKEHEIIVKLSLVDGTHLTDTKTPVKLTFTEVLSKYWSETNDATTKPQKTIEPQTYTGYMNKTGFVTFKVMLPDLKEYEGYSHYYELEAEYRDEKRQLVSTIHQKREPKKIEEPHNNEPQDYFKILDKYYNRLKLNKPHQITLNSSKPISYFDYNIVGRGNILKSGHVELEDKPKVYNLTLTPEILWAPSFNLYVYYVDENGEYHYAEQSFSSDYELENSISITADEQVKPGDQVALKIKTSPNSFVGLMAVDQSVLLMKSNNDLKFSEFNWAVASYRTNAPHQGGSSYYPGTASGCVTLTNADYFYNSTRPDYITSGITPFSGSEETMYYSHSVSYARGGPMSAVAGPGAASADSNANIQVRKDFSETWLFDNIENTDQEEFTWSKKIPDTITSWMITGFAMNSDNGLAVTKDKTKVTTFKPFFISVRLPYSVKRGEVINVPALVFNYLEKTLDVEVTLDNSDGEFEFTDINNEVVGGERRTKTVSVPANGASGVAFMIRPIKLGNILLKYTAKSAVAGDAIHKPMKVVPEGITQYGNRAYFVNLKDEPEQKSTFELELPADIVPDSQHVEVGVVGDILGPVLNNLDRLVRLPTGCGEQTMSTLLPNYLVMKYLKNSNRLTPSLETKLRFNMNSGYQNLLKYRHNDGSFSSFGPPKDTHITRGIVHMTGSSLPPQETEPAYNGSTWLTAYVTRSFQQLKEFIDVDPKIIDSGLEYLAKQQAANGSFTEKGNYFYVNQANHVSLTSTVLLAFLEDWANADKYPKHIEKGLDFIAANEDKSNSLHAQAIATYTLNKAKHSAAKEKLSKLNTLAQTDEDRKWWSPKPKSANRRWWFYVYSSDIEITSYVLLTLLNQKTATVDDVLPIIRWLIGQRNSYGGFSSTQDTVVGLQALMQFAKLADYQPAKMDVAIASKGGEREKQETVKLAEDNDILYQSIVMPDKTTAIDYSAKGTGTAMVQIAYQYNIYEKDSKPSFTITVSKMDTVHKSRLTMFVCAEYMGEGQASNMAMLEINTPSGYVVEEDSLPLINEVERVSNTELKNSGSLLVVYFDHLYKDDKTCIIYEAMKTHAVALQKKSSIVLYDYYDTSKKATEFYSVDSKLCDICEGEEECSKCK